jgi:hypothetical protein
VRTSILRTLFAALLLVAALTGCGSSDDDAGEATTTTTTAPADESRALTPDEAFDRNLTDQLEGVDAAFIGGSRAAGRTLCGNLTTIATEAEGDDPASELTPEVLIGSVIDGFSQPQVAAVVLRAAVGSYCPEHTEAIEEVLADRGE